MGTLEEQIRALPKVELHLHLDGSVKPETVLELGKKVGANLPTDNLNELSKYLLVSEDCKSLGEYLEKFALPLEIMQTEEGLERVAHELCETLAEENVRYFEVRFAPQLHTAKGLDLDRIVQAVLDGLNEGQIEYDIKAGLILCGMRHLSPELNLKLVDLAVRFKDKGVVGIDLAGDEAGFPVEVHAEVFKQAASRGINITIHAGEAEGAQSVKKSLDLGAVRIGHGVRTLEDPNVLQMVKDKKILLEVCPKSNLHTKAVTKISEHPIKSYFDQGIRVTINTDNRSVSNTSLTEEYLLMVNELGFSLDELKQTIIFAAEAAFLPAFEKARLIEEIKAELNK